MGASEGTIYIECVGGLVSRCGVDYASMKAY